MTEKQSDELKCVQMAADESTTVRMNNCLGLQYVYWLKAAIYNAFLNRKRLIYFWQFYLGK